MAARQLPQIANPPTMWAALLRAIQIAGPISLGFVSNDFIAWLGRLPLVGSFFSKKDAQGSTPWYVTVAGMILVVWVAILLARKIFKVKIL